LNVTLHYFATNSFAESVASVSESSSSEIKKLRKENQELKEMNNLLEYKIQLLIDMVNNSHIAILQD
jgi:hypothetical protein